MKKVILFAFAVIGFITLPSFALTPAIVIDSHSESDVAFTYNNPCTGLDLDITGHEEFDAHVVDNGNRVSISSHINGQYTATDADGNSYVGHWTDNFQRQLPSPPAGGTYVANVAYKVHFVGQGGAEGFDLIQKGHLTVNANGDMVVNRFEGGVECK
jgi:hypothetical protein